MRPSLQSPVLYRRRPPTDIVVPGPDGRRDFRSDQVRFVPAGWLVVALTVLRHLLKGGSVAKLGIGGLVWALMPRKLKLLAAGLAAAALIVVVGALATIVLLAMQLS